MIFRRKNTRMNIIIGIILGVFLFVVLLLFLRGNEDDWLCIEGNWIKHGNPSAPMPVSICH